MVQTKNKDIKLKLIKNNYFLFYNYALHIQFNKFGIKRVGQLLGLLPNRVKTSSDKAWKRLESRKGIS